MSFVINALPFFICFLALLALMQFGLKRIWNRLSVLFEAIAYVDNRINDASSSTISVDEISGLRRDIVFLTQQLKSVRDLAFCHSSTLAKLEAAAKKKKR